MPNGTQRKGHGMYVSVLLILFLEFSPTPKFVYLIGWFIDLASQLKIEERGEALGQRR